jgi:hypothetical protein
MIFAAKNRLFRRAVAAITVSSGLVNYWPLDTSTETGGTTSEDIVGTEDLTLVNSPALVTGQVSQGYDLESGDSDHLASAASQGPQSACSIALWAKLESVITSLFISKYSVSAPNAAYLQFFVLDSGDVHARIQESRDSVYIGRKTATSTLTTAVWYHLVMTWSGGTTNSAIKVYVDATQVDNADDGAGSFTAAYAGSDLKWCVGALFDAQGSGTILLPLDGIIDDVRVYDRELSGSEVNDLRNAGLGGQR